MLETLLRRATSVRWHGFLMPRLIGDDDVLILIVLRRDWGLFKELFSAVPSASKVAGSGLLFERGSAS